MHARTTALLCDLTEQADEDRLCLVSTSTNLRRELARLRHAGVLVSPWRGMYAAVDTWAELKPDEQVRRVVRTLALKHPGWVFSHLTAANMHGLYVSYADLLPLHVVVSPNRNTRSTNLIVRHQADVIEPEVVDGVTVTPLKQTSLDCMASLDFKRGLAIADSTLRIGGFSRAELIRYIKENGDSFGQSTALDAAAWANSLAANGGESMARATMIEQGFMIPKLQVAIPNIIENGVYYADFKWEFVDRPDVVGELDGLEKYMNPMMTGGRSAVQVLSDERRRESRIGAANLRVMRFSFQEVLDVAKFTKILLAFGIPRGHSRPRGRMPQ